MSRIIVGIDPGTHTGYAVSDGGVLIACKSTQIHRAMKFVQEAQKYAQVSGLDFLVRYEDAHKRKWLGTKGREALQGAGSIKRDCTIWHDFLTDIGVKFESVAPGAGKTKWPSHLFAKAYKWDGRTNEHARDAGVLAMIT